MAVAEELNFTRAARRTHVVQSALSYQVAQLEREVGVALFERTSRSVRLTTAGELLMSRARNILAARDDAQAELRSLAGVLTGRLRLGIVGSAVTDPILEAALVTFHGRHPGVEIAVQDTGSSRMADEVHAGSIDLAVVGLFADQVPPGLGHRLLASEPLVAVVPAGHVIAGRATTTLDELAAQTRFVEMRSESGLRRQLDAAFARAGVQRTVAFELSTSEVVVRFVALGFGAALVPRSVAARAEGVAMIELEDPNARHPISVIHRSPLPSAPSARAFLELLGPAVEARPD